MDAVMKIGGSLAEDPERLRALCTKLSEFAKKYAIVVVPGGGRFADVVRDFDKRFILFSGISHRMDCYYPKSSPTPAQPICLVTQSSFLRLGLCQFFCHRG
jgi:hypothetical protein